MCPASAKTAIAQLLVDSTGRIPEVELVLLPSGCSGAAITDILKRWRYSEPKKFGRPIATVEVITITFQKEPAK